MTRLEEALDRCQQSLVKAKETGNMRLAMMFEKCIERLKEYMSQPPKEEESDLVKVAEGSGVFSMSSKSTKSPFESESGSGLGGLSGLSPTVLGMGKVEDTFEVAKKIFDGKEEK